MALVEIDENELAQHRQVSQFLNTALQNPKTRRRILEAQKELNPNAVIPELDAAAPIMDALAQIQAERAAEKAERQAEKDETDKARRMEALNRQWEAGRTNLRSQGWTQEGIEGVEKLMEQEGIASHDVGANHFNALNPPAEIARSSNGGAFDMMTNAGLGEDMTKLLLEGNDEAFLRKMVPNALAEVRGSQRR